MGRRVAGVGVGVALLVLGLEAPAFAVTPTIASFTPASGPGGCVVVITGTSFQNPVVQKVKFGGQLATDFAVKSDTEIWATVPDTALSGPISVENGSGTATSSTDFIVPNSGGGACTPTIASFTPTCGPSGTPVTITGTNLLQSTSAGGDVYFAPYGGLSPTSGKLATPVSASPTELVVPVPGAANGTGPLAVTTFDTTVGSGAVFSDGTFTDGTCITDFQPQGGNVGDTVTITGVGFENVTQVQFADGVIAQITGRTDSETTDTITVTVPVGAVSGPITLLTPDAANGTSVATPSSFTLGGKAAKHERAITLKLVKHLKAKGKVTLTVDTSITACIDSVPVKDPAQQAPPLEDHRQDDHE